MRSCTGLLGQVRPSEKHVRTIWARIMEVCSLLLTGVQKKTSQQLLSVNGRLWGSSYKNVLLWLALTSHKCSLTWHCSVGCKPTEVVPHQGQHGPVISPEGHRHTVHLSFLQAQQQHGVRRQADSYEVGGRGLRHHDKGL